MLSHNALLKNSVKHDTKAVPTSRPGTRRGANCSERERYEYGQLHCPCRPARLRQSPGTDSRFPLSDEREHFVIYWGVARPGSASGEVLVRDGYVVGDDAAIAQIADVGVQFAMAEDGSRPMIWVSLGSADARVSGFGDQSLDHAELEAKVRRCVTEQEDAQRRAAVEAMIEGS